MQHRQIQENIVLSIYNDLQDKDTLLDGKPCVGVVLENIQFHEEKYCLHLRRLYSSSIPDIVESYAAEKVVIKHFFLLSLYGMDLFLLAMERESPLPSDPICIVGEIFGIQVHGHCMFISDPSAVRKLRRSLNYRVCASCGNKKNLLKCNGCLCKYYCNLDCQKADWKEHKKTHFIIQVLKT